MTSVLVDRVCGSNFAYQHHSLEQCFDDLAALDRTQVELWGVAPHAHVDLLSDGDARSIRSLAADRGLEIVCFTPEQVMYPVNIAAADDTWRAASISTFHRAAQLAIELGAQRLLLTSGRGQEDEPRRSAWIRATDSLGEITAYAAALGLDCVLEPLQRVESNLVVTADDAALMLSQVASPALGVVLDTVAANAAGDSIDDYFAALGDRVRHVHLIDGSPTGHLAWGDGCLPLGDIVTALDRQGYLGAATIELFGDGRYALNPRPVLARSLDAVAGVCAVSNDAE
ncbi:sugar phosphate isomerase/epimerase family protein [Microbacterium sp.]|uniref:sugar phosphate isomerase/epimerase family protein n=1 Tax=Microbacterium sp. TaxID=51671 RepID=UPI003F9AFB2F